MPPKYLPRLLGLPPGLAALLAFGWSCFGILSFQFPHLALWLSNIILLQLLTAVVLIAMKGRDPA